MADMWMVRAGPDSFLIDDFIEKNIVAIGWNIGDLSNKNLDEINSLMDEKYPQKIGRGNEINSDQVNTFVNIIKKMIMSCHLIHQITHF